jgi:hypothetical protein
MDFFDEFDIAWIWVILVATVKNSSSTHVNVSNVHYYYFDYYYYCGFFK